MAAPAPAFPEDRFDVRTWRPGVASERMRAARGKQRRQPMHGTVAALRRARAVRARLGLGPAGRRHRPWPLGAAGFAKPRWRLCTARNSPRASFCTRLMLYLLGYPGHAALDTQVATHCASCIAHNSQVCVAGNGPADRPSERRSSLTNAGTKLQPKSRVFACTQ